MKISIRAVRDAGVLAKERVVLTVDGDDDIGRYAIFDTTFTNDGEVSNLLRHTYWFPDKSVKSGDLVVLYTRSGRSSEKVSTSGSRSHFFYWGLSETVWNKDGDGVVLAEISDWVAKQAVAS